MQVLCGDTWHPTCVRVQVLAVMCANGMAPFDAREAAAGFTEARFYEALTRCFEAKKKEVAFSRVPSAGNVR